MSGKIDRKDLLEELQNALEEDKRYWIKNDAKIKAVVTAKDYDEFRETVAAAHLKPLKKLDFNKNTRTWNSLAK